MSLEGRQRLKIRVGMIMKERWDGMRSEAQVEWVLLKRRRAISCVRLEGKRKGRVWQYIHMCSSSTGSKKEKKIVSGPDFVNKVMRHGLE